MNIKRIKHFRFTAVARALLIVMLVSLLFITNYRGALAADLINRKVILASSGPGDTTSHTFQFTNPTANTLGSIVFEYCSNSPLFIEPCTAPAGFSANSAALSAQSGNVGFVKDPLSTINKLVISRVPGGTLSTANSYQFSSVINPTAADTTFFVRISLYATNNATGASFDKGSVAFSTSGTFSIGAYVPPFLIFCVGVTVASNCSSTNGSLVNFGELVKNNTSSVTTQFAAATNAPTGLQIFLNGQTLTSGNNIIPGLSDRKPSIPSQSQFGINLRANSSPSVGSNPSGVGTIQPTGDYDNQNQYKFLSGEVIARSAVPTDFNVLTVSYIANIDDKQSPGVYATTLLYTALASF